MAHIGEDGERVQVCAALSMPEFSTISSPISVALATRDSTPGIYIYILLLFICSKSLFQKSVSAAAGSDYTAISSPLMFPAGSHDGSEQCVNVSIVDDETVEEDETFTVELTVLTSGVVEGNALTTVVITDNEGNRV